VRQPQKRGKWSNSTHANTHSALDRTTKMKLNAVFVAIILASVAAKRVINLAQFQEGYESEAHHKRLDMDDLSRLKAYFAKVVTKCQVDLDKLKGKTLEEILATDRDEVLIPVFEGSSRAKRAPKNVVALDLLRQKLGEEVSSSSKRDLQQFWLQLVLEGEGSEEEEGTPLLQSTLAQVKDISIFAGYVRDQVDVAQLTGLIKLPLIIIAPADEAISRKLGGLKPWEFPRNVEDDETNAELNLASFVRAHVVKGTQAQLSSWGDLLSSRDNLLQHEQTLESQDIEIKRENGETFVLGNGKKIKVLRSVRVNNGFLLVVDGSLVVPA
jgi:hypothetical protein